MLDSQMLIQLLVVIEGQVTESATGMVDQVRLQGRLGVDGTLERKGTSSTLHDR